MGAVSLVHAGAEDRPTEVGPPGGWLMGARCADKVVSMIHENLSQSIEDLSSRMIAIRDSL